MGNIIVHEYMTLDAIVETPTWSFDYGFDPRMGEALGAMMDSCEAILLGRETFEMFAATWPNRNSEDDPGAPFFNESPKYVVSGSAESFEWTNAHVLGPYDAEKIRSLKAEIDGNL
ncbi:MAG TPA: dihydrofolate reductase family protein, partial [Galbitalea sp.]